jgi:ankyrin repeat protein
MITALPIIFLLSGNLYSLILISSYYQLFVLLVIGLSSFVHYICLKAVYRKKTNLDEIIEKLYKKNKNFGTKETNNIFWMSVFTSWVAPCTVWANNKSIKTRFLLLSSFITIAVNMLSIIFVYIRVNKVGLMDSVNPPITHSYNDTALFNTTNYLLYECFNSSHKLFCFSGSEKCLPKIRICLRNEGLLENVDFQCCMLGILFLCFSLVASGCLQDLGNNDRLHSIGCQISCIDQCKNKLKASCNMVFKKMNPITNCLKNMLQCTMKKFAIAEEIKRKKNEEKKLPPMHRAIKKGKYGRWCTLSVLGGLDGALNGQRQSTIQILWEEKDDQQKWKYSNTFVTCWIRKCLQKYGEHALHNAVKLEDTVLLETIIENGYYIDEQNLHRQTALHIAAEKGHLEIVKFLVDKGADTESKDKFHQTPLHWASKRGHFEIVKYLFEKGEDKGTKYKLNQTPLHDALEEGHFEIVKYFVEKGADKESKDCINQTPLHIATEKGHFEIIQYLVENGADKELKDYNNQTPLHFASKNGHFEVVKYLVEKSSDKESKDRYHQTPLHLASEKGHFEIVKYLVEMGADMEAKNCRNALISFKENNKTALHLASEKGHLEIVKCLVENGANKESKDECNQTSLHLATKKGNYEIVKYLVEKGADTESKDEWGLTPLHLASARGHFEIVKYLVEKGPDKDSKDDYNRTPLHLASEKGHFQIVKYLVENGADKDSKDNLKQTPLHIASMNGHFEIVKFLVQNGAHMQAKTNNGETPLNLAAKYGRKKIVVLFQDKD